METSEITSISHSTIKTMKPFMKIPGGKRKLVHTLLHYFPEDFFQLYRANGRWWSTSIGSHDTVC